MEITKKRDVTVLAVALLLLFVDALGAWELVSAIYSRGLELTGWQYGAAFGAISAAAAGLFALTFLLLRRMAARAG